MSQTPTPSQAAAPSLADRLRCEVLLKGLINHGGQLSEVLGDITTRVWVERFGALMVCRPLFSHVSVLTGAVRSIGGSLRGFYVGSM